MASSVNANKVEVQASTSSSNTDSPQHQGKGPSNFEPLDESTSNTLKRNPKMELNKADFLKLLSHLEGELQARDVVIATLKSEKLKQLIKARQRGGMSQAAAALQEDSLAMAVPNLDTSIAADMKAMSEALDNVVAQNRCCQLRMARMRKEMELRHRKVVQELEEEKRKHEHDTAQGDDITYGLEKERTRLKQELEIEKQAYRKLEKELKRATEVLEEERARQKQIVLLLLAERKKLVMKYVEERKRSEDLAQIVSEEKLQMNAMADGLEEESKKSLQMEAELEKQLAQFDVERQQLKACVAREQLRVAELEAELERAHKELAEAHQVAMFQASVAGSSRPAPLKAAQAPWVHQDAGDASAGSAPMVSSVAKVVQPTATVSSVPVCGPTTGIARSVSPGHVARGAVFPPVATPAVDAEAVTPPRPAPAPGKVFSKSPFHAAMAAAAAAASESSASPAAPPPKKHPLVRGTPPPVPPNKPVVPPKKDAVGGSALGVGAAGPGPAKIGLLAKEKAPQPQVGSEAGVGGSLAQSAAPPPVATPQPPPPTYAAASSPPPSTVTAAARSVDSLHASSLARDPSNALLQSVQPSGASDVTAVIPSTPGPCSSSSVPSISPSAATPSTQHEDALTSSTELLPEQKEHCSHTQFEQTEICMLPKVDAI